MTEFLWFLVGFLISGLFMNVMMCCLQLHRCNKYEAEIRSLRSQLNNK